MGICISCLDSCFGSSKPAEDNRIHERTSLLEDHSLILPTALPHINAHDQQRDQEELNKIVDRAAENLIDIHALNRNEEPELDSSYQADRIAGYRALMEGLEVVSTDQLNQKLMILPNDEVKSEDRKLMDSASKRIIEALHSAGKVENVGDVFVKLKWEDEE